MNRILVVDDVPQLAEQYAYDLRRLGSYEVIVAGDGRSALDQLTASSYDCVVLDLEMPGMDGFEMLRTVQHRGLEVPIIVYTGTGDFDRCVQAVRLGAAGFIDKAEPMERVVQEIETAIDRHRLRLEVRTLQRRLGDSTLLGASPAMVRLREAIARAAPVPSAVLVTGESGTGKELVARELHRFGANQGGPFIAINCAALPEQLVESELFGHERGAFTGAISSRKGAFEAAEKGTILLDEVGELPLAAQSKLLRVLEDHTLLRVGSTRSIPVTARVVAATNRDLEVEVRDKRFRDDLLYRLNVLVIRVPALRERREDIVPLASRFLEETCRRFGVLPKRLSDDAAAFLVGQDWARNNVRELRNVIERSVVAADGEMIRVEHLEDHAMPSAAYDMGEGSFQELRTDAERRIVLAALERHQWHITRTAQALGLADHASLLKVMRRLGVSGRK